MISTDASVLSVLISTGALVLISTGAVTVQTHHVAVPMWRTAAGTGAERSCSRAARGGHAAGFDPAIFR